MIFGADETSAFIAINIIGLLLAIVGFLMVRKTKGIMKQPEMIMFRFGGVFFGCGMFILIYSLLYKAFG